MLFSAPQDPQDPQDSEMLLMELARRIPASDSAGYLAAVVDSCPFFYGDTEITETLKNGEYNTATYEKDKLRYQNEKSAVSPI